MMSCQHAKKVNIPVKYIDPNMPTLEMTEKGDFVDLSVRGVHIPLSEQTVEQRQSDEGLLTWEIHADTFFYIKLGVAMKLPENHEAWVTPRGSLFKKKFLLLTNSPGIIDNSFCGENDEWLASVYATRRTRIVQYEKLFQFRIVENQPRLNFEQVDMMFEADRGSFGSTDNE